MRSTPAYDSVLTHTELISVCVSLLTHTIIHVDQVSCNMMEYIFISSSEYTAA